MTKEDSLMNYHLKVPLNYLSHITLVVLSFIARSDRLSAYNGPSPRDKEKEKKREMIDERKNVRTIPYRIYCKCSRPVPYSYPN